MTYKLPLFPLNAVLFPGFTISLHVFEERYRLMIERCLEQEAPFGIVLIRKGPEVGGDAIPYQIGTVATIQQSKQLPDGRYYLNALGQRRFRVQYIAHRQPYPLASVADLPEEFGGAEIENAAQQLRELYARYWAAVNTATGSQHKPETPPEQVVNLTYWMAQHLNVNNQQKQRWLEADVATRLREMSGAIRNELLILPDQNNEEPGNMFGMNSWN